MTTNIYTKFKIVNMFFVFAYGLTICIFIYKLKSLNLFELGLGSFIVGLLGILQNFLGNYDKMAITHNTPKPPLIDIFYKTPPKGVGGGGGGGSSTARPSGSSTGPSSSPSGSSAESSTPRPSGSLAESSTPRPPRHLPLPGIDDINKHYDSADDSPSSDTDTGDPYVRLSPTKQINNDTIDDLLNVKKATPD